MRRITFGPNHSRLRRILLYGVSRGTTDALLALRGLVLASLLPPEAFGGWALFRLATRYGVFAGLGVHRGLEFEVARGNSVRGPGATTVGVKYLHAAQGFGLLVFGTIALASLAASLFVDVAGLALALRWFAAAIITEQLWLYGLVYLRALGNLRRYAAAEVTNAALHVGCAALLAPFWGLAGAFAGFALATLVSLALLTWHVRFRPAISGRHLGVMIRVGFPILVSLFLATVLATADRLVVAGYGGTALLGLYAFGVSIAGLAGSFAWVVRTVVFPDVFSHAGSGAEEQALQDHLAETVMPFAWLVPPCLGALAFLLTPLVSTVVPDYLAALPAARIFIFTGVTTGYASLGALGVVAAGRQKLLPLFSGIALVLNVTLSLAALRSGIGLSGVAAAALISSGTFGIAILVIAARVARVGRPAHFVMMATLPLAWCVMSVAAIATLRSDFGGLSTVASLALYVLSLLPLVPIMVTALRKATWPAEHGT